MGSTLGDLAGLSKIDLVGREIVIKEINKRAAHAAGKDRPTLIRLEGRGGIGKTAVLEKVRYEVDSKDPGVALVVKHILDVYHLDNQTVRGFCDELVVLFPEDEKVVFQAYHDLTRDLDKAFSQGNTDGASQLWAQAETALFQALRALTLNRRGKSRQVWILVDTAERLYEHQSFPDDQQPTGQEMLAFWLSTFFENLLKGARGIPIVFLMAGRPIPPEYKYIEAPGWLVKAPIKLDALSADACAAYLETVAQFLENKDKMFEPDKDGGARIRNYLRENSSMRLWHGTGGEPLYLAMVSDILRTGGSPPNAFYQGQDDVDQSLVRQDVVKQFMNLRSPLGITLQTLAQLRRGADAALLALAMAIDEQTAAGYLKLVGKLALVKERPGETKRRFFLHDEIYDLYARHDQQAIPKKDMYERIVAYYDREMKDLRKVMRKEPENLQRYQTETWIAQIEKMHYALWFNPWQGYGEYFAQSVEAIVQQLKSWDNLLTAEWERTAKDLKKLGRYPQNLDDYMVWDDKIRVFDRASTWRGPTVDKCAYDELVSMIANAPVMLQAYFMLVCGLLDLRGQISEENKPVVEYLEKTEKLLQEAEIPPDLRLVKVTLEAYVNNYYGYANRRAGKYKEALAYYHKAGVIMRQQHWVGLNSILINQAYAMSMMGFDRRARETAQEAYDLAVISGGLHQQVRALNVRALVETSAGFPREAEEFAKHALDILNTYPQLRLRALVYISLARVYRYWWNQVFQEKLTGLLEDGKEFIPKALVYLEGTQAVRNILPWFKGDLPQIKQGAIDLLAGNTDHENWIVACNESGSLWREAAWLAQKQWPDNEDHQQQAGDQSSKRLKQACGIGSTAISLWPDKIREQAEKTGGSLYWPLLALVNLGWHKHYQYALNDAEGNTKRSKEIVEICNMIEGIVDEKYLLHPESNPEGEDLMIWGGLGKMEMLRGYEHLRNWRHENNLEDAITRICRAMEYNYQIGSSTYNTRRAEMGLDTRMRQSNNWESKLLPSFFKTAQKVAEELKLREDGGILSKNHVLRWLEERYGPAKLWIQE